eukprot:331630_1
MSTKLSILIPNETKRVVFWYCSTYVSKHITYLILEYYFILTMDNKFIDTGYMYMTDTLQGSVFMTDNVVIKRTSKYLHNLGITIQKSKQYKVSENIIKEYVILSHINSSVNCPSQITKVIDFIETEYNYYLVMENAGKDFFDFVSMAHKLINDHTLKIKEWRKFVKYMFYQMVIVVHFLHNQMNICHMNISLENICVQNGNFILQPDGYYTIDPNIKIKLIDFGLAELFDPNSEFECVKYCGITAYKAPEVYRAKSIFYPRKADVWSLGVVLFCMAIGSPPYVKPCNRDDAYKYFIKTGQIDRLLFQWNKHLCVTIKMLDLLKNMMKVDINARYVIENILTHPWVSVYKKQYEQLYSPSEKEINNHKVNVNEYEITIYKLPTK